MKSILLLSLLMVFHCIFVNGNYIIRDLNAEDDTQFSNQVSQWTLKNYATTKYCTCKNNYVLGGCDSFGMGATANKTYTNLPTHNVIYYQIDLWYFGSWNNELPIIKFDTKTVNYWGVDYQQSQQICETGTQFGIVNVQTKLTVLGRIGHSASSLSLEISSSLDEQGNNEALGIRNISLIFSSLSTTVSESKCGKTQQNMPSLAICACNLGQYLSSAGSCEKCPSSCLTCRGDTTDNCYTCNTGNSTIGTDGRCKGNDNCYQYDVDLSCLKCETNYKFYQGACVTQCPSGTYEKSGICEQCSSNCDVCQETNGVLNCQKCIQTYSLYQNACVQQCPAQTYSKNGACQNCNSNCQQCSEINGKVSCSQCNAGYLINEDSCVASCPPGTYQKQGRCPKCQENCQSCQESNSQLICSKCNNNYFFNQNSCVSQCPTKTYQKNGICTNCPEYCDTCTDTECTKCTQGYYKVIFDKKECFNLCTLTQKILPSKKCQTPIRQIILPSSCGGNPVNAYDKSGKGCTIDIQNQVNLASSQFYAINFDNSKHYLTQLQGSLKCSCKGNKKTMLFQNYGCFIASFAMILRVADIQPINNKALTPEVVANELAPLITNENCDFIFDSSALKTPFKNQFIIEFAKKDSNFLKTQNSETFKAYNEAEFKKAINLLASSNPKKYVMARWYKSNLSAHTTLLISLEIPNYSNSVTMEYIYNNIKIKFADPDASVSTEQVKSINTLCFTKIKRKTQINYCLGKLYIYTYSQ